MSEASPTKCLECGPSSDMFTCDGGCGARKCVNCEMPRCCKLCDGLCCEDCLGAGHIKCGTCVRRANRVKAMEAKPSRAASDTNVSPTQSEAGEEERHQPTECQICGFVRRPYQPPEYVQACYNCEFAYCFLCKDGGKIKVTPCCEEYCSRCPQGYRKEPYLLTCENCSSIWCVALCCNKDCKGGAACEDKYSNCKDTLANGGHVSPHIYHCKKCGLDTCQECCFYHDGLCMNGCDEED